MTQERTDENINIGSDNGLLQSGNRQLPEQMLINFRMA